MSCTVKAYYALKLAGDDIRSAAHGAGARRHTRSAAARPAPTCSRASRWRCSASCRGAACRIFPVEIMLLPKWFPFHLDKVAYWSRTVMVPLFILCTRKPVAKNPRGVDSPRALHHPPEEERHYFRDAVRARRHAGPRILGRRPPWTTDRSVDPAAHARNVPRAEPRSGCSSG